MAKESKREERQEKHEKAESPAKEAREEFLVKKFGMKRKASRKSSRR